MNSSSRRSGRAAYVALVVSLIALVGSTTGLASAAKKALAPSAKPKPHGLLLLGAKGKFPAKAIPKVAAAKKADTAKTATKIGSKAVDQLTPSCAPTTVDVGTWCMDASPYPLADTEIGKNDYFFATAKCVEEGGWLPTAAQLVGAASRVKLSSTIGDSQLTATIDIDPSDGLTDKREMSGTLVTTAAGSTAAGSEGVSDGAKGDPKQGQPDPTPLPANPQPATLQYVTVYDNADKGGFAGSQPVSQPQAFRCAYAKAIGAADAEAG